MSLSDLESVSIEEFHTDQYWQNIDASDFDHDTTFPDPEYNETGSNIMNYFFTNDPTRPTNDPTKQNDSTYRQMIQSIIRLIQINQ